MANLSFTQKNILSNNINSKISGIYTIISEQSKIYSQNTKLNSNYTEIVLNNSDFITKDTHINDKSTPAYGYLTINNINNSNVFSPNCKYIINSENNGGFINFPSPYYNIKNSTASINLTDSVLYPTTSVILVKDLMNNGIETIFNELSGSTLYNNIHFKINGSNNIVECLINNISIKAYNRYALSLKEFVKFLPEVVKNLPRNMNGYNYIFEFTESIAISNEQPIIFDNFHGGKIYLQFNKLTTSANQNDIPFRNAYKFINCDHIEIYGKDLNNSTEACVYLYSANNAIFEILEPIFLIDNCQDVLFKSIIFQKYYKLYTNSTTKLFTKLSIKGNLKEYLNTGVIYTRNSNVQFQNCIFFHNLQDYFKDKTMVLEPHKLYYDCKEGEESTKLNWITKELEQATLIPSDDQYSIMAFNSKLLFTDTKFDKNLSLLLDEFSLASDTSKLNNLNELSSTVSSANIAYANDGFINNGLYNHYHTDYLEETNLIPIGSMVGYKFWFRYTDYYTKFNSLKSIYTNIAANELIGIAMIEASNCISESNRFPDSLLPLCCGPDGYNALKNEFANQYKVFSERYAGLDENLSALSKPDILVNTITPFEAPNNTNADYDFYANNILFHSAFCKRTNTSNIWQIKTESDFTVEHPIIGIDITVKSLDNHGAWPPTVTLTPGTYIYLAADYYPLSHCHKSGNGKPFFQKTSVFINLSALIINELIGSYVMNDLPIDDLNTNKIYKSILNNSKIYTGKTEYKVLHIVNYYRAIIKGETNPYYTDKMSYCSRLFQKIEIYDGALDANATNTIYEASKDYFPIHFKYYMIPNIDNSYNGNGVFLLRSVEGDVFFSKGISCRFGGRKGGDWGEYLYANGGRLRKTVYI